MGDERPLERQLRDVLDRMAGPEPAIDALRIARTARAAATARRLPTVLSATRFLVAGLIVGQSASVLLASIGALLQEQPGTAAA